MLNWVFSKFGHGGGIITRRLIMAVALVACMVVSFVPIFGEISGSKNADATKITAKVAKTPSVHASYFYVVKKKKTKKKSSKSTLPNVGATIVKVNSQYVESTARCSCSLHKDYKLHSEQFKNYCQYCKKSGKLKYERGRSCPEGMWVCSNCDADFCMVHGKSHVKKAKYLIKA
ncbi:MAG: hypothetical protein Q8S06_02930 [Methanobacteriaceae archaeon]|nr:hypothetical protein [Methanobacteriaceae archaeon]